ncbi:MAG: DNA integrity scanning diadenylate cyclase DisA [Propionicimonas sp.]|nr:DNA integrity scanning diadenylate cyclase DisA [Propionicimonas sp.]
MDATLRHRLREGLALLSPGTELRDGLDRIVHGRTGALIVLGHNDSVDSLVTGGFGVDVPLTSTALRELAKLDGAILLDAELTRIIHAGAHLMPEASLPTTETGTRHRTADRVARQTGLPVVTVSASMSSIALFLDGYRYPLQRPEQLMARADQTLATLERYRDRLTDAANRLTALEVQDAVTVDDVAGVAKRVELVHRLAEETREILVELGTDGRMVDLQLQELLAGLPELADSLARDYGTGDSLLQLAALGDLAADDLLDHSQVARRIRLVPGTLDARLPVRGYRQLALIGRLPSGVAESLVEHFGSLQSLLGASTNDLLAIEGIDYAVVRQLRDGLARLTETTFAERLDLPG